MDRILSWNEAVIELERCFQKHLAQGVKSLLESKHLYQSITIDFTHFLEPILPTIADRFHEEIKSRFLQALGERWIPVANAGERPSSADTASLIFLYFQPPDVKVFCQICDRIEAFNLISSEDFFSRGNLPLPMRHSAQTVQIFVFSFLCQSCKTIPEVFLIRREGFKLTNSGRSPIEYVDVPSDIPNPVKHFYRGAVVAHQSGQTLAGIFLLRTLIEQWARSKIPSDQLLADAVLDAYMATLPENFKSQFKSFRELYGELSVDIHAAKGDPVLFNEARDKIVEHFEARRLFRL
jgi:hypothetical protein